MIEHFFDTMIEASSDKEWLSVLETVLSHLKQNLVEVLNA